MLSCECHKNYAKSSPYDAKHKKRPLQYAKKLSHSSVCAFSQSDRGLQCQCVYYTISCDSVTG